MTRQVQSHTELTERDRKKELFFKVTNVKIDSRTLAGFNFLLRRILRTPMFLQTGVLCSDMKI